MYKSLHKEIVGFAKEVQKYINSKGYSEVLFDVDKVRCNYNGIKDGNYVVEWVENTIHDCPEGGWLYISMNKIYNNTWQHWIDKRYEYFFNLQLEEKRKNKEEQEKREKELLKQLKSKYEHN